jgi:hypothetical protein
VIIGENNGVLTCFNGKQWCVSGVWGECGEGVIGNEVITDLLVGSDDEPADVDEPTRRDSDGGAGGEGGASP